MRSAIVICCFVAMSSGCKDSNTPTPEPEPVVTASVPTAPTAEASATAEPSGLRGGWKLVVRSESPGLNPDLFDTPDKKAKVFFDHHAEVSEGRVQVKHGILKQTWSMKESGQAFDELLRGTDWAALAKKLEVEGGSEGGTVFHFTISVGDTKHELKTADLDAHPPLLEIVKALKATAGVP